MLSPEKINDLRKRVLADEPVSESELAEAIKQMIAERLENLATPKGKGKSIKKTSADLSDLL